jgi:predicted O-methyltransferase YrrM
MNPECWAAVDNYVNGLLIASDPVLDAALKASEEAGLPGIQVSAAQGKLLHLLAKLCGARAILEIGTLGGYSAIWLARALPPGGRLVTLEVNTQYAEVAVANLIRAALPETVEVEIRAGKAIDTLERMGKDVDVEDPFDMVFIDADKESTPEYFQWALKLSRAGSLILVDNVVRSGALIDGASDDPRVQGMRRFHEMLAREPRVSATTIQTVGSKGYDGFTLCVVV